VLVEFPSIAGSGRLRGRFSGLPQARDAQSASKQKALWREQLTWWFVADSVFLLLPMR
jgi:hypothetical protein